MNAPIGVLVALWPRIHELCPEIKFQLVPFENTQENAREILKNLGQNIDVVAGIFDDTMLNVRNCAGFEISRQPICCAVSIHHRLADKNRLAVQDLYGEKLMLMHRNWSHYVDELRDDIWQNHSQIQIVDFDFYSVDVFNRCENSNDVLMAVQAWDSVHPLLKVIPVEWNHSIPYGLLYSPSPSETVKRFLSAIQTVLHQRTGHSKDAKQGNGSFRTGLWNRNFVSAACRKRENAEATDFLEGLKLTDAEAGIKAFL